MPRMTQEQLEAAIAKAREFNAWLESLSGNDWSNSQRLEIAKAATYSQ